MSPAINLSPEAKQAGVRYGPLGDEKDVLASFPDASDATHLLLIPSGVQLTESLEISISDSCDLAVLVKPGARVLLTVTIAAKEAAKIHMHVIVQDEAACDVVTVQQSSAEATVHISQQGRISAGATLHWQNVTLGGKEVHQDLESRVVGHDGESSVDWMFYAKDSEKYDLTARNVFEGKSGGGEIVMKGVAEEKAHVGCDGMIEIGLGGGGTNTYLTQNVLMLDTTAKVDAIPGLEIKTNDVKASHSATVSRVTGEDLFYFAARGIPQREARRLYVLGFLSDLTKRVQSPALREQIVQSLEEKYETTSQI